MQEHQYKLEKQRTSLRAIITSVVILVVGGVLLFWTNNDAYWTNFKSLQGLARDLGSLLVVSIAISILWELTIKRSFVEELLSKAKISQELRSAGLIQIDYGPQNINWNILFETATELDVFVAYAKSWRGWHGKQIQQMLKKSGAKLRFIIPDPDSDIVCNELSIRFNSTIDAVRQRIKEAKEDLLELKKNLSPENSSVTVEIYLSSISPAFTMYRFDNIGIIAFYSHRRKVDVPHLVSAKGGYIYEFIRSQINVLINDEPNLVKKI